MTLQELYDEVVQDRLNEEYKAFCKRCFYSQLKVPQDLTLDHFKSLATKMNYKLGMKAFVKNAGVEITDSNIEFKSLEFLHNPYAKEDCNKDQPIIPSVKHRCFDLDSLGWSYLVGLSYTAFMSAIRSCEIDIHVFLDSLLNDAMKKKHKTFSRISISNSDMKILNDESNRSKRPVELILHELILSLEY